MNLSDRPIRMRVMGAPARVAVLSVLFIGALIPRLVNLDKPPMEMHPTRQFFMALIARDFYLKADPQAPSWRRDVSASVMRKKELSEPRIMQFAASLGYRALGGERLWFPRLLSVIFYLTGGAALFALARRAGSFNAALLAAAFYLFCPFGIVASRSFQPDPLMLMLFLFALLTLVRYVEVPSGGRLAAAAVLGGLTILVKPQSVFMLGVTAAALLIRQRGSWKGLFAPAHGLLGTLMLLPGALYYGYYMTQPGYLSEMPAYFIVPSLLATPLFWARWIANVNSVVGVAPFLAGLFALFMTPRGCVRSLLLGGYLGYLVFGLVFSHGVHVHDYYSLPLIPFAALGVGLLGERALSAALGESPGRARRAAVWAAAAMAIPLSLPTVYRDIVHRAPGYVRTAETARRIGEVVGHSTRCLMLTSAYGEPLRYYGELDGTCWPDPADYVYARLRGARTMSAKERLDDLLARERPDCFVVDNFDYLRGEPELRVILLRDYPRLAETADYVIFDLRAPADGQNK